MWAQHTTGVLRAFTRTILLYWGVYALDFGTSACFILLGYGAVETNQFQRSLFTSPGPASLLSWAANQGFLFGIGILAVMVIVVSPSFVPKTFLGATLALLSLARMYGVATNVAFTLEAVLGGSLHPTELYLPMGVLLLLALVGKPRKGLRGMIRVLAQGSPGAE